MALNSGTILMRRGQEVNFDPNKMTPGEWAVSLDSKYVRMCFAPGVCVRMATYDAFEADMEQIKQILAECQTVEEVVTRINDEISVKEQAVAEYTAQAKQYRDEAEQFRNQAFSSTPEGYLELVEQVVENTRKIEEGVGGVSDYEDLDNKPKINEVELSGNKTLEELGVKPHALTNPTNNLLATEAGTPLDAVQGKTLDDKIKNTNVSRKSDSQYNTLEEFVEATASSINVSHMGRFKDLGDFSSSAGAGAWKRYLISYQNPYVSGSTSDIGGNGLFFNDGGHVCSVKISGNKDSGLTLSCSKLVSETELNNRINNYAFSSYRVSVDANYGMEIILGILDSNGISNEIKQLGITLDDTLEVALSKIFTNQRNAYIRLALNSNQSIFNKSLPNSGAGVLEIHKINSSRGYIRLFVISNGEEFTNNYVNNALGTWQKISKTNV